MNGFKEWPSFLMVFLSVHVAQYCCARVDDDGCISSSQHRCPPKVNYRQKEKEVLDQILGPGSYDARIRPSGVNGTGDSPCIVFVNMLVRSISRIDDYKMEYSVQLTFREQWMDERLKFNDYNGKMRYLTLTEASRVWMPDLFFSNEKEGHFHNIIMPNVYIRIFPNGLVLYSIRISLTLSCPMNLKLYPLDRQTCSLRMVSYGWTTDDLVFLWKEGDPVQVVKNLHLPRFTLEKFLTDYCNSKTNTGEYSCLKVDLLFKREFSYYLIQIYIPCCMLVIVSWVSFWLDQSAVPARVSLGVTTLLTMATQTSGINASLPPVSYTKAIDVWTGVCLTFVFGALLEFALVNYASRSDTHRDDMSKKCDLERTMSMDVGDYEDGPNSFNMVRSNSTVSIDRARRTRFEALHLLSSFFVFFFFLFVFSFFTTLPLFYDNLSKHLLSLSSSFIRTWSIYSIIFNSCTTDQLLSLVLDCNTHTHTHTHTHKQYRRQRIPSPRPRFMEPNVAYLIFQSYADDTSRSNPLRKTSR